MKIRFAIVSPDILAQVRAEVDLLLRAVNAGDIAGVDVATTKLQVLTSNSSSVVLSEDEWRVFMDEIRRRNPAFQSNYLLPSEVCTSILPTVSVNEHVLELPIDGDMGEDEINV